MPAITGNEIVSDAFAKLNVFLPGITIPNAQAQFARRTLNDMLSEWSQRDLMIPVISRERFHLVANQGGPDNPYTIGPGGNFNTARPSNQDSIVAANLILTATTPEVRVPLAPYTDQGDDAIQVPGLTNTQPTGFYYSPTYANDLGTINLWPVPTIATNDLELFLQKDLAQFADLTTTYYVPDAVPQALKANLADRLQGTFGRTLAPADARLAVMSLGVYKRANTKLSDLLNDAAIFGGGRPTMFNINTGQ